MYPNHFLTAIIAIPISASTIAPMVSNLALIQAWVPRRGFSFSLNQPSWSLSCELFFDAMFPSTVAVALRRVRADNAVRLLVGVIAAIAVLQVGATFLGTVNAQHGTFLGDIFPPVRFLEFVLGRSTWSPTGHPLLPGLDGLEHRIGGGGPSGPRSSSRWDWRCPACCSTGSNNRWRPGSDGGCSR